MEKESKPQTIVEAKVCGLKDTENLLAILEKLSEKVEITDLQISVSFLEDFGMLSEHSRSIQEDI